MITHARKRPQSLIADLLANPARKLADMVWVRVMVQALRASPDQTRLEEIMIHCQEIINAPWDDGNGPSSESRDWAWILYHAVRDVWATGRVYAGGPDFWLEPGETPITREVCAWILIERPQLARLKQALEVLDELDREVVAHLTSLELPVQNRLDSWRDGIADMRDAVTIAITARHKEEQA